jgi:tungstate transport system substrate-binding protein
LKLAERGDVDVVLVHERAAEDAFVASGHGIDRRDVMHNDLVLVGPADDPAGIAGFELAADALAQILRQGAPFLSRGDESGTHQAELRLWRQAGLDPHAATGGWYRASGAGMGATLNIATNMGAYTLTDRATWTSFHNREGLRLLVEGDPSLHNPYGVIRVDPERFGEIDAKAALAFADWLTGEDGRAAIESFYIDGTQVFFVGEVERRVGM